MLQSEGSSKPNGEPQIRSNVAVQGSSEETQKKMGEHLKILKSKKSAHSREESLSSIAAFRKKDEQGSNNALE